MLRLYIIKVFWLVSHLQPQLGTQSGDEVALSAAESNQSPTDEAHERRPYHLHFKTLTYMVNSNTSRFNNLKHETHYPTTPANSGVTGVRCRPQSNPRSSRRAPHEAHNKPHSITLTQHGSITRLQLSYTDLP